MKCPSCGSRHTVKLGYITNKQGRKQRMKCQDCGTTFYPKNIKVKQ